MAPLDLVQATRVRAAFRAWMGAQGGRTYAQTAEALGLSVGAVERLLSHELAASRRTATKVAQLLGVPLESLLGAPSHVGGYLAAIRAGTWSAPAKKR